MRSADRKKLCAVFYLIMAVLLLAGCSQNEETEPTIPKWGFQRKKVETVVMAATAEDFPALEQCVNLKYLDLTGSTCYEEILNYVNSHPQVEVIYTAPLGGLELSNSETHAALERSSYEVGTLLQQLQYLPGITNLELPRTHLSAQELQELQTGCPDVKIQYTVDILGQEYAPSVTSAEFADMDSGELEMVAEAMTLLPELTEVTLPESLEMTAVKDFMDRFPEITFHYTFDLFGKTLTTAEERVEYVNAIIGNQGEDQIRAALDIMPRCTYFKLENCGLDNEVLASIRDDYPDTKIVWRVSFGGQYSLLTDETTLRTVYGVENSHGQYLKYCTSLKYIDMGHNPTLTDISFIEYMPDLEIVILSGASMTNVDAFANHKKLEWLELANCYALNDISALESCDNLRFLNICFSKVTDLTPIENLPLERFLYLTPQIDKETQTAFEESHPDCWVRFTGQDPYSLGWRYNDIGVTRFEYYQKIRDIFQYDAVDRRLAQQAAQEEAEREEAEGENGGGNEGGTTPPSGGNEGGGNEGGSPGSGLAGLLGSLFN